jgi:hypothetical protein
LKRLDFDGLSLETKKKFEGVFWEAAKVCSVKLAKADLMKAKV